MRRLCLAMGLFGAVGACRGDAAAAGAIAVFERFQDAVFARDAAAVKDLVTDESRPAVDALPWAEVASRRRLQATDAEDMRGCFHIGVRDPNEGDSLGFYVVVREHGRLVVDLVATAALAARPAEAATSGDGAPGIPDLEMRELTPDDHDRLRRLQLESPPGRLGR